MESSFVVDYGISPFIGVAVFVAYSDPAVRRAFGVFVIVERKPRLFAL